MANKLWIELLWKLGRFGFWLDGAALRWWFIAKYGQSEWDKAHGK